MSMFDSYEPAPDLSCPVCGSPLTGWQGKDADNVLFVWRQGQGAPVDWEIEEEIQTPGAQAAARLPARFSIRAHDEAGHTVLADCSAPDGTWSQTTISGVLEHHTSRKGAFFTRVLWGSAPWLTKASRDR